MTTVAELAAVAAMSHTSSVILVVRDGITHAEAINGARLVALVCEGGTISVARTDDGQCAELSTEATYVAFSLDALETFGDKLEPMLPEIIDELRLAQAMGVRGELVACFESREDGDRFVALQRCDGSGWERQG